MRWKVVALAVSPMVMITWDVVSTPDTWKDYAERSNAWVNMLVACDGVDELRAYWSLTGLSPQRGVVCEFRSETLARHAIENWNHIFQDMRAHGVVNIEARLFVPSEVYPHPIRKEQ